MAAIAIGVLLSAGCGPQQSETETETEPSTKTTAPSSSAASSSSPFPTDVTTQPDSAPDIRGRDTALIRDFVEFATHPSEQTAAALPFATVVRLGLGRDLLTTVRGNDISDASKWVLDVEYFRATSGPFNALRPVKTTVNEDRTEPGGNGSPFKVSVGEHPHCASPPMAPPDGLQTLRRVSLQPADDTIDTCLRWFSVDLFLNQERRVVAVTLDVWEP